MPDKPMTLGKGFATIRRMVNEAPTTLNVLCAAQVNPADATPMMRQFIEVKQHYPGVILFYRMGDFYETFFEDAVIIAKALEITLTGREAGKLGRVPMAGVPAKAVEGYVQRLLDQNFKVAICEQMEDPALAKGLVERRVTRVLSPGTVADSRFLNSKQNNFLAAIFWHSKAQQWGLCYGDVSTGLLCASDITADMLSGELDRIAPSELLVLGRKQKGIVVDEWVPDLPNTLDVSRMNVTPLRPEVFDTGNALARIQRWFTVQDVASFGLTPNTPSIQSIGGLLGYLEQTYIEENRPVFDGIRYYQLSDRLSIGASTRRHLELTQTLRDNRVDGSLLHVLDKTHTGMGARLLRQWIQAPSIHLPEIQSRLEAVETLVNDATLRDSCNTHLPHVYDVERLATKVQNATVMPKDWIALCRSLSILPNLTHALAPCQAFYLIYIAAIPPELQTLVNTLQTTLLENPAIGLKEGGIFKPGYHAELDTLRSLVETQETWLTQYEQQERERTGLKTLKVGNNSAFGYYIEISKALSKEAPPDYQRKQTLTNAERYITPELKQHEEEVLDAKTRLFDLEYQLYIDFRQKLLHYGPMLKETAHRLALLDVFQSLATVAVENRYIKPIVDDSDELTLQDARHPVIESMLPLGQFVSNHCALSAAVRDHRTPQLMIITGPNMAGKSTYMRQVALIVLMAQMGSFVPASYARIGLVDQLFTRIGAVDDLASGQSTFMVEMTETAQILNCATRRSLVLLDEVGRGTSTYDGVAIAWSVAEQLVNQNGCRTLFATHYHELNTLEQVSPKIQNYRVLVSEENGTFAFLHKVVPGAAQKSYGIQVAKMAGLPTKVIQKAERLLNRMQEKELTVIEKQRQASLLEEAQLDQLSLFNTHPVSPNTEAAQTV